MAYQFPNYFTRTPVIGQPPWAEVRWKVYNRSGSATAAGNVYQLDMSMSQSQTTNYDWMDAASVWRNIVVQSTSPTGTGSASTPSTFSGIFCVATEAVADDAELEVLFQGTYSVLTLMASATHYVPKWAALQPVGTKKYVQILHGSGAITGGRQVGRSLVAVDQGSATDGQEERRSCFFSGFGQVV